MEKRVTKDYNDNEGYVLSVAKFLCPESEHFRSLSVYVKLDTDGYGYMSFSEKNISLDYSTEVAFKDTLNALRVMRDTIDEAEKHIAEIYAEREQEALLINPDPLTL